MSLSMAVRPNRLVPWLAALIVVMFAAFATPHIASANGLTTGAGADLSSIMADVNSSGATTTGGGAGMPSWFNWHNVLSVLLFLIVPIVVVIAIIPVIHALGSSREPGHLAWSFIQIGGILVCGVIAVAAPMKMMTSSTASAAVLSPAIVHSHHT